MPSEEPNYLAHAFKSQYNLIGLGTAAEIKKSQDEHVANAELISQLGGSMMVVGSGTVRTILKPF